MYFNSRQKIDLHLGPLRLASLCRRLRSDPSFSYFCLTRTAVSRTASAASREAVRSSNILTNFGSFREPTRWSFRRLGRYVEVAFGAVPDRSSCRRSSEAESLLLRCSVDPELSSPSSLSDARCNPSRWSNNNGELLCRVLKHLALAVMPGMKKLPVDSITVATLSRSLSWYRFMLACMLHKRKVGWGLSCSVFQALWEPHNNSVA